MFQFITKKAEYISFIDNYMILLFHFKNKVFEGKYRQIRVIIQSIIRRIRSDFVMIDATGRKRKYTLFY